MTEGVTWKEVMMDSSLVSFFLNQSVEIIMTISYHTVMVIEAVFQNRLGVKFAWQFFKEHIKEIYSRYGHGLFLMSKVKTSPQKKN